MNVPPPPALSLSLTHLSRIAALGFAAVTAAAIGCLGPSGDTSSASDPDITRTSAGLADDSRPPVVPYASEWPKGAEYTIQVTPRGYADALDGLKNNGSIEHRRSMMANSVRATGGSLASIGSGETCPQVMLRFLEDYGSLLFDAELTKPVEPLKLRVLLSPSHYRRGDQEGVIVMFRQDIDGFQVEDNLVSARCMGDGLTAVWGGLYNPLDSATRAGALAIASDQQAATLSRRRCRKRRQRVGSSWRSLG